MFTDIKEKLPEQNVLVLIKRIKGPVYLGYRNDKPLSSNPDASRETHWTGRPMHEPNVKKNDSFFYCEFSDVTVSGWALLEDVVDVARQAAV